MFDEVEKFVGYLRDVKKMSQNTILSYRRDLLQFASYMADRGVAEAGKVTKTSLDSYILFLEREGKAAATISRMLASIKAFFHYESTEGYIKRNPAEMIRAPKIEKKAPSILSVEEVTRLLNQPGGRTPKEIRDKAMLELLYATGIRVSELMNLNLHHINMTIGFITCSDSGRERTIPFGRVAKKALDDYLKNSRPELTKKKESDWPSGLLEDYQILRGKGGDPDGHHASHAAPLLCRSSDQQRSRHEGSAADTGTFGYGHYSDVCCLSAWLTDSQGVAKRQVSLLYRK